MSFPKLLSLSRERLRIAGQRRRTALPVGTPLQEFLASPEPGYFCPHRDHTIISVRAVHV